MDGVDVSKEYLPVYMAISGWYSPSDCHMMVEGPPHFLKVRTFHFILLLLSRIKLTAIAIHLMLQVKSPAISNYMTI